MSRITWPIVTAGLVVLVVYVQFFPRPPSGRRHRKPTRSPQRVVDQSAPPRNSHRACVPGPAPRNRDPVQLPAHRGKPTQGSRLGRAEGCRNRKAGCSRDSRPRPPRWPPRMPKTMHFHRRPSRPVLCRLRRSRHPPFPRRAKSLRSAASPCRLRRRR